MPLPTGLVVKNGSKGTLWRGLPRPADVIALQPSTVAVMPKHVFEWLCESELAFTHFLIQQISERMYWFMEGWDADRVLDAEGKVTATSRGCPIRGFTRTDTSTSRSPRTRGSQFGRRVETAPQSGSRPPAGGGLGEARVRRADGDRPRRVAAGG
ncbi:hypothetical protein ASC76_24090 [Rhizobacter sp. Root404]|nr:hypothetical protein [Rhizobacter sp. Root404]KQW33498.1 hypothetical protein ASC76_24090 [Rhizobacter sp. Root404]